jgi:hypothetical protein
MHRKQLRGRVACMPRSLLALPGTCTRSALPRDLSSLSTKRNVTARSRRPSAASAARGVTPVNYSSVSSRDRPESRALRPREALIGSQPLSVSTYTIFSHSNYCPATESISPDAIARAVT